MKRNASTKDSPILAAALREPDAAQYTGWSRAYLKKSRLFGTGPAFVRVGRSITYRICDLDSWLASHVVKFAK